MTQEINETFDQMIDTINKQATSFHQEFDNDLAVVEENFTKLQRIRNDIEKSKESEKV